MREAELDRWEEDGESCVDLHHLLYCNLVGLLCYGLAGSSKATRLSPLFALLGCFHGIPRIL